MRLFIKLAVAFFVMCLVIFGFALTFGPRSYLKAASDHDTPVGKIQVEQPASR